MAKKVYKKPIVSKVALKPEEAALQGCKSSNHGGRWSGYSFCSWWFMRCSGSGS